MVEIQKCYFAKVMIEVTYLKAALSIPLLRDEDGRCHTRLIELCAIGESRFR